VFDRYLNAFLAVAGLLLFVMGFAAGSLWTQRAADVTVAERNAGEALAQVEAYKAADGLGQDISLIETTLYKAFTHDLKEIDAFWAAVAAGDFGLYGDKDCPALPAASASASVDIRARTRHHAATATRNAALEADVAYKQRKLAACQQILIKERRNVGNNQ